MKAKEIGKGDDARLLLTSEAASSSSTDGPNMFAGLFDDTVDVSNLKFDGSDDGGGDSDDDVKQTKKNRKGRTTTRVQSPAGSPTGSPPPPKSGRDSHNWPTQTPDHQYHAARQ